MRCALGSFAIGCSFAVVGTVGAQDAVDPASTPRQFLEQSQEAPAPPPLEIAPVDSQEQAEEADFALGKRIQFEAAIIHLKSPEDFSEEEQAVTGETVDALLQNWKANGKMERMSILRLTSVDKLEGFVTIGEQVPVTTARMAFDGRGGGFQNAVTYQDVGTVFAVRGQIDGERITIECNVEESRLEPAGPAPVEAPSVDAAEGASTPQADLNLHSTQKVNSETVLSVEDGGKVIVSTIFTKSNKGSSATIITLKATILP
jgi:hypothetical protein